LHQIGDEVGIPKDLITRAATNLDRPPMAPAPTRKFLGATTGVGRTAYLPRPLTDSEWNRLVVDLRETFNAKGVIQEHGAFRQWTNGNLQALLEPTENGERLRLQTTKGSAYPVMGAGALLSVVGTLNLFLGAASNLREMTAFAVLAVGGLVLHLGSRLSLPTWARTRAGQMEGIIARLTASVDE
jgi:hypothetical protein